MAKTKKQEKTIEQRLEEALVLYEKTPYELPSNWCWTRLIHLVNHQSGNSKLIKGKLSSEKTDGLYDGYSASGQDVFCPNYEHEGEAIIVSAVGARCGKAFLAKGKWSAIANTHIVYPKSGMNIKFLFYLMNDEEWWVRSGSAQPFVVVKESLERPFALPPHEEQKRIVEIIDKQFAKLDEARDLIQKSLDSFADRKSAILHKAFTGELTKGWRICKNIDIKSWDMIKLGQLGILERGKSKHRPRNDPKLFGGKYPFVQTGDIANANKYILYHKQTLSEAGLQQSKLFPKGTLCITIAANIGDVAILSYDCCFPDSVVGFTPYKEVSSEFIYYKMKTLQSDLEANAPATAQKNINLKILNDINICIPTFIEQEEIVRILNEFFEKEDKSKELIDMLDKIDEMKKSILARAFRGQLGTSNPTDEPATDLLRKILEQNN